MRGDELSSALPEPRVGEAVTVRGLGNAVDLDGCATGQQDSVENGGIVGIGGAREPQNGCTNLGGGDRAER